jgi:putative selenium metabolism protein SsnA
MSLKAGKKGAMAKRDIIIKNACVITGRGPVFPDGFVRIRAGRIMAAGNDSRVNLSDASVIDAKGRYVLPGFINPHMHLYGAFARGMEVGRMKSFGQVLKGLWWKLDRELDIEDIYVSAMLGGIEAIRSGVTTLIDHHASYGAISGSLGAISEALAKVGIRTSLCFEISDRAGKGARDEAIAETGLWLESVNGWLGAHPDFLQRGMVGLHASMTLSDKSLEMAHELMDMYGVGAHVHVAEGVEDVDDARKKYGVSPVARLMKHEILRPGTLAVHCVHVDSNDISTIKKSGATVVHNPMSNLGNAVGVASMLEMYKKGIPVVVGTDGMSAGIADDIRLASVVQRPGARDAQAGWCESERALWKNAPSLVSQMFGTDIGIIREGAAADVIIMDSRPATPVTSENAWGHMLFGVLSSAVRTTIVGGSVRMKDFAIRGIDEEMLADMARGLAVKLWKRIK